MNDRELLELAAKAHGKIEFDRFRLADVFLEFREDGMHHWFPLEDDGDALRLAVKLNLEIQIAFNEEDAKVYIYGGWVGEAVEEELGELDRYEATRRAIVRAAAEIGRTMP